MHDDDSFGRHQADDAIERLVAFLDSRTGHPGGSCRGLAAGIVLNRGSRVSNFKSGIRFPKQASRGVLTDSGWGNERGLYRQGKLRLISNPPDRGPARENEDLSPSQVQRVRYGVPGTPMRTKLKSHGHAAKGTLLSQGADFVPTSSGIRLGSLGDSLIPPAEAAPPRARRSVPRPKGE